MEYIYKDPLCLPTKYALSFKFRELVERNRDCKVINVIETKCMEVLTYIITCPDEKRELISDMAFMTWIKNPKFQKYFEETAEFKIIAAQYLAEIPEILVECTTH